MKIKCLQNNQSPVLPKAKPEIGYTSKKNSAAEKYPCVPPSRPGFLGAAQII
jgi:hypothetical protein